MIETVGGWIERLGLVWSRWDYNIEPMPMWKAIDPTLKIQFAYMQGLYRVLDTLMADHPDWMVEGCASGGRRVDMGTMRRAHTFWFSDQSVDPLLCRYMQARANRFLPGHLMSPIILRAQQELPSVPINTRRLEWADQEQAVVQGLVDVSFARAPITHPELDHTTVAIEPRVVGVHVSHPLAARSEARMADILHEPLVTSGSCPSEEWRMWWAVAEGRGDVPIVWGPLVDTVEDMLQHVALGHAIVITAYSVMHSYSHPMVRFLPLVDAPPTTVSLCWLRDRQLPLLRQFLTVAHEVVAESELQLDIERVTL